MLGYFIFQGVGSTLSAQCFLNLIQHIKCHYFVLKTKKYREAKHGHCSTNTNYAIYQSKQLVKCVNKKQDPSALGNFTSFFQRR
jgi:hypothetical protein